MDTYTVNEAAARLNVSRTSIYNMLDGGKIKRKDNELTGRSEISRKSVEDLRQAQIDTLVAALSNYGVKVEVVAQ